MDTTQGFFADLLEKSWIGKADPARGRFRAYVKTVFRRFMSDKRRREAAVKRGGDRTILSIDAASAEQRFLSEPADAETPEDGFERRWALSLLDRVLTLLEDEYSNRGRLQLFQSLRRHLVGHETVSYAATADQLGMTVSNVKVSVHRLRQRYRQILTREIAQTVESEDDVENELRLLLAALQR